MKHNFLHNHPMEEQLAKIGPDHVIVDRADWEEAKKLFVSMEEATKKIQKIIPNGGRHLNISDNEDIAQL